VTLQRGKVISLKPILGNGPYVWWVGEEKAGYLKIIIHKGLRFYQKCASLPTSSRPYSNIEEYCNRYSHFTASFLHLDVTSVKNICLPLPLLVDATPNHHVRVVRTTRYDGPNDQISCRVRGGMDILWLK
jgi:hypothetical protein